MSKGTWNELPVGFDAAVEKLPAALRAEGFGVLTTIDVQATLKEKLGVDFRRYRIFGACNPKLAHEALSRDAQVGVLLPCNVVLYERDDGKAMLGMVDPLASIGGEPAFGDLAETVRGKLERVAAAMKG
jgi:uncharacterized protein (DUF302 family)